MDELTVSQIKVELIINESALLAAIKTGIMRDVADLKTQRDELKNMLIEKLESQLTKAA